MQKTEEETAVQDISLYRLFNFYVKKWRWVLLLTLFGALAGFIYNNYIQVPLYKSDATLLIVNADSKTNQDTTLINSYLQLLKSRRVLEPVIKEQNPGIPYEELADATTATNQKNTEVIKVSIASKNPEQSKKLVEGVVLSFREEVKNLYKRDDISIVDGANQAGEPYNVHLPVLIVATAIAGFSTSLLALFFAFDISLNRKATKVSAKDAIMGAFHKIAIKPALEPQSKSKDKAQPKKRSPKKTQSKNAVPLKAKNKTPKQIESNHQKK